MASKLIRAVFAALLAAALPLGAQVAAQNGPPPPIDKFVVFGDSLSDPGNAYIATGEFEVRPYDPIPDAPYLIGRFHFSNGATWVEQLARESGLPRSGKPALQRPGIFTNYAFGRARARPVGPFDLGAQVDLFLTDFEGVAEAETLYVLWIGANDLRDALAALEENPTGSIHQLIISQALAATAAAIQELYAAGARSFLVLNLPNIGDTPALRARGAQARAIGRQLSEGYNTGLDTALDQLENLPDIVILRFDVFTGLEDLVQMPDLAGLMNVTDSCITPDVIIGAICQPPRKYLFWDFIHPTRAAHAYHAEQAKALLETELFIRAPLF
jgi:phospholipase/lecithinase/hemolysin